MIARESFANVIRLNKLFLQHFGILPLNGPPTIRKTRFSNFLLIFTISCISSISLPIIHFLLSANLDLKSALDVLNVLAGVIGGQTRMILVALNRKKIQHLYATCEALWFDASFADFKIIFRWGKQAKLVDISLFITTFLAVSLYVLLPAINQITINLDTCSRSWPYQIDMDPSQSPRYEIHYIVQAIAACVSLCSMCGCDIIGSLIALHACGQLKLIQYWLLEISKEEKHFIEERPVNKKLDEQLKKCIRRHQIVMNLCAELEEVVCYLNLSFAISGMCMIGISASRLSKVQSSKMYVPIAPLLLAFGQLFLSCWPANKLLVESTTMVEALYEVPWHRCSPAIRKTIIFMMMRSQRPARLTAGKFVTFSLETFTSTLSTSGSLFTLLRSFDSGL